MTLCRLLNGVILTLRKHFQIM